MRPRLGSSPSIAAPSAVRLAASGVAVMPSTIAPCSRASPGRLPSVRTDRSARWADGVPAAPSAATTTWRTRGWRSSISSTASPAASGDSRNTAASRASSTLLWCVAASSSPSAPSCATRSPSDAPATSFTSPARSASAGEPIGGRAGRNRPRAAANAPAVGSTVRSPASPIKRKCAIACMCTVAAPGIACKPICSSRSMASGQPAAASANRTLEWTSTSGRRAPGGASAGTRV